MKSIVAVLRRPFLLIASAFLPIAFISSAEAQVVTVPRTPQVGSSNPVSAEPLVSRPETTPCKVQLLNEAEFAGFTPSPIAYTPPKACPGPWAKVVLTVDLTVTAGRQFDRTAEFILGGANIFYGTTPEPRRKLSPSWHVERDVTDLSAIFMTAQTGMAEIGNVVDSTYTGIIYANSELEFYPASAKSPAPRVADIVVPVDSSGGDAGSVNAGQQITQALNLPPNVERVYLDVFAQSQSNDEFWYLSVPNDVANELETFGGTAFRETEITIDGVAAGVAPVYPWIYTGGLDPYLWEPITGVQTLDFKPYRVDLTPFAGPLADGAPHTIGIGVFNANNYFLVTGNVLVFTDHGSAKTYGEVTSHTLPRYPIPTVDENLKTDSTGTVTGTVAVGSNRTFEITGYVETSHGRVETTVAQTVDFLSTQTFDVNVNVGPELQNVVQTTTVDAVTTTRDGYLNKTDTRHFVYPLTLNYSFLNNPDGTYTQTVTSDQKDIVSNSRAINGNEVYRWNAEEQVNSTDTIQFDSSFELLAAGIGNSRASYAGHDSLGNCYSRFLESDEHVLTTVTDGTGCTK